MSYNRSASGRVRSQNSHFGYGSFDYTYDYAGRLLRADNRYDPGNDPRYAGLDQSFTYDAAGNMLTNSRVGRYTYRPNSHVLTSVAGQTVTHDANGNMTLGLNGKRMTYDGENRPESVTLNGVTTRYDYAADGSRLKRIDNAGTADETVTVYFGPVEIRNFGQGADEEIVTYPHPEVRLVNGVPSILARDQLGSVRTVLTDRGVRAETKFYRPFGETWNWVTTPGEAREDHGFVGQRHDAGAGLLYLNARYMDPELGRFIQPDWLDPNQPGVGTNRYAYSFTIGEPAGSGGECMCSMWSICCGSSIPRLSGGSFSSCGDAGCRGRNWCRNRRRCYSRSERYRGGFNLR